VRSEDVLAMISETLLVSEPGLHEARETLGPDVAGFLLERLCGQPLDVLLDDLIFAPLGMLDTGFYVREEGQQRLAHCYRATRSGLSIAQTRQDSVFLDAPSIFSASGLVSTVDDLEKFSMGLRGLLRTETLEALFETAPRSARTLGGFTSDGWLVAFGHATVHIFIHRDSGAYAIFATQVCPLVEVIHMEVVRAVCRGEQEGSAALDQLRAFFATFPAPLTAFEKMVGGTGSTPEQFAEALRLNGFPAASSSVAAKALARTSRTVHIADFVSLKQKAVAETARPEDSSLTLQRSASASTLNSTGAARRRPLSGSQVQSFFSTHSASFLASQMVARPQTAERGQTSKKPGARAGPTRRRRTPGRA
jgi:hypothetical protein